MGHPRGYVPLIVLIFGLICHADELETTTLVNELSDIMVTTESTFMVNATESESTDFTTIVPTQSSTEKVTIATPKSTTTTPKSTTTTPKSTTTTPKSTTTTPKSTTTTTKRTTTLSPFRKSSKAPTDTKSLTSVSETDFLYSPSKAVQLLNAHEGIENSVNTLRAHKEILPEDLSNDLINWVPPKYLRESLPMYLSGFDYDDQPIWVCEMGKYDLHAILRRGPHAMKDMEMFTARMTRIMLNSNSEKNPLGYKGNFILDFDGLKFRHFAQVDSFAFLFKLGYRYRRILEDTIDYVAIINANYPAHALIDLWRPMIGRVMEVVDIYGPGRNKWQPHLLRKFPRESLPEWYGGYKNFTPYKVF